MESNFYNSLSLIFVWESVFDLELSAACPLKKRHNQTFFHKRTIERLCASDDHKSEITEILDLCDYDYIVSVKNIFLFCVFFT